MTHTLLLTGATGFLGTQIARRVLRDTDCRIVALVRAVDHTAAQRRLSRTWWDWPELAEAIGARVEVVCGDVAVPHLGLDGATYDRLAHTVIHIIHTAADLRLNAPIDELRLTNVGGTAHVLELARAAHADHGLKRFSHVSTAYVAGGRRGDVPETALTDEFGFSSRYELSKYEGERLVAAAKSELPISVFRPGMIVGDSRTGEIRTFNTLYYLLRLYLTGKIRTLPAHPNLRVNMIPVDYVADVVARLTFETRAEGLTFHLTAPSNSLPTVSELADFLRDWAHDQLGIQLPRPRFIPLPRRFSRGRYRVQSALQPSRRRIFDNLLTLLPYFYEERQFRRDNVERLTGPYELDWREFMPPILAYGVWMGFLHRSGRTIHEQILFRLKSRHLPVTYHDIMEGEVKTRSGPEVREDILAAAGALHTLGIRAGDRVALAGLNSSRYLTLDVAIGLVGAVSVPLYYTSPPSEVSEIIRDTGARLLMVGVPSLLESVDKLDTQIPTVSFCRETKPADGPEGVMSWGDFLALGEGHTVPETAPIDLGDLATLRYTSGTTGRPKGVAYRHDALRWMAESLTPLFPWKSRNQRASYLSFLPMNHVVEGILGMYSPYYVPAPMDIYFLEDFACLQQVLPIARPRIFFSVPRFFEKMYEAVQDSRLVRYYRRLPQGFRKRLVRRLLRHAVLRKAGLDCCVQIIVGAAPPVDEHLRFFHAIGIDIHNAYGLTEAPLVTLNRLGANRIGTVGTPLPETEVRLAEDGEVFVRGPQAAAGYYKDGVLQPFPDGWGQTGDLGRLNDDGSLVLVGRKREAIITSYGKNIHPAKVETLLRQIPGVCQALLIGDGKPYCVALLWVEENTSPDYSAIDQGVRSANARLSRPEQVKRWAVLVNDLTVERGDLTATFKMKRQAIVQRYKEVIRGLYNEAAIQDCVLHTGRAHRPGQGLRST